MQGSQEGKRAKLWGPRAHGHFGANISMKIADILQHHHWFPREMTSGKRAQKFLQRDW